MFRGRDDPHARLTASEVADALDCTRPTAYDKLTALAERADLRTKKIGAREDLVASGRRRRRPG